MNEIKGERDGLEKHVQIFKHKIRTTKKTNEKDLMELWIDNVFGEKCNIL